MVPDTNTVKGISTELCVCISIAFQAVKDTFVPAIV
jgi:hypothetical protein